MVLEKDIRMGRNNRDASLIHYLYTYPTMQGRGYATRILKLVFNQSDTLNLKNYAVTKFPEGHHIAFNGIDMGSQDLKSQNLDPKYLSFQEMIIMVSLNGLDLQLKRTNIMILLMNVMI